MNHMPIVLAFFVSCVVAAALPEARGEDVVTEPILTFTGHTGRVNSVVFSPDGTKVLTGSMDKTARLWDAASGALVRTFSGHTGGVYCVTFSPDGIRILTSSGDPDNTVRLWSVDTGAQLRTFQHNVIVRSAVFSPDGTMIITGSADKKARLWNAATGELVRTFIGHSYEILSVVFSRDGARILTGSGDNTARLWDVGTGLSIRTFSGHFDTITSVAFSHDGTKVLTGSWDSTARLWDAATGVLIHTYDGHTDLVRSAIFAPSGTAILTASYDCTARLWDVVCGNNVRTFNTPSSIPSAAFSPDGTKVLTGHTDNTTRIWSVGPLLSVRSMPLMDVSITGDVTGLTGFTQAYNEARDVSLIAPALHLAGAVSYDFIRWQIDGQPQPDGQLSVQLTVDRSMTATAIYQIMKRSLTVTSSPIAGVAITGDAPGTTDYTASIDDQQTIQLTAPPIARGGGSDYGFIRWTVDGADQPQAQTSISLTMDADRAAVAVYFRARLSVTSEPYTGIYLSGSHGDVTPYERILLAPQDVTLSTQLRLFRGLVPYNFTFWTINRVPQPPRQTDIQFHVDADTTVRAVYTILGDVNADCVVNVLDLLLIRNRLGKPIGSGDAWQADVNLDGTVDVLDLISTRNRLGTRCR